MSADEIVRLIVSGVSATNLKQKFPPDAIADAIISIVRSALNSGKNLKTVLKPELAASLGNTPKSNTARLILKLIQNSLGPTKALTKPTAEEAVKVTGAPGSNSILKIILDALAKNETPAKAEEIKMKISQAPKPVNKNTANLILRVIMNLFRTNGNRMEPSANFFAASTFRQANRPKNGRKWYFGTKNDRTGWHLNTGGGAPSGPVGRPNFFKLDLAALLRWRRENPGNTTNVNSAISKFIKNSLDKIRYSSYSSSDRLSRLIELLKQIPPNFSGRREIVAAIIALIREVSSLNRVSNFIRNLRGVNNRNIRNALEIQRRRLQKRRIGEENYYERRVVRRYPGESNFNYGRRRENTNALRRAIVRSEPPRARPINYEPGRTRQINYEPGRTVSNENAIRRAIGGGAPPPPLPSTQQRAINNVGGPTNALQKVALVPGGAPEVAKAAEALNETGGNVRLAINTRGVSPAAIKAVQNLGGVSQTVKILEGLNTMAQTPETQRRKATRRPKKSTRGVRLTELNRVINAVKKQKLISLMAHNITRTNNIHPNDEKLKKHYKKVMKSYILRTKFANIAKRAAKKRVQ